LKMKNGRSWMFNLMDRSGIGAVYKEEFIRYVGLASEIADPIVAEDIYFHLMSLQKQRDREERQKNGKQDVEESAIDADEDAGILYDTWKLFLDQFRHVFKDRNEDEWTKVKKKLGIDSSECLVQTESALDHSEVLPTPGVLYLSHRYLVFFASMGVRHWVIRLECVASVSKSSLPVLMRDCLQVHLEPEYKTALRGIYSRKSEVNIAEHSLSGAGQGTGSAGGNESDSSGGESPEDGIVFDPELAQAAIDVGRQFSNSAHPLVFSFMELNESKRRDQWLYSVQEMSAAYNVHNSVGFKEKAAGRVRSYSEFGLRVKLVVCMDWVDRISSSRAIELESPFRNDPRVPLLALIAAMNVMRSQVLKEVTKRDAISSLFIFSRCAGLISTERASSEAQDARRWYLDTVRTIRKQTTVESSWMERTVQAIQKNIEINNQVYKVEDEEPFDVGKFGEVCGRFWSLIKPGVDLYEAYENLIRWKQPPATVLAIVISLYIYRNNLVSYLPSLVLIVYCAVLLVTRLSLVGMDLFFNNEAVQLAAFSRAREVENSESYIKMVTNVHAALQGVQNVISSWNRILGKIESLNHWAMPWMSWVLCGALVLGSFVVALIPMRHLFLLMMLENFTRHFRFPGGDTFWEAIPIDMAKESNERMRKSRASRG